MGLLNTMETILTVMEDKEEVHAELEPIVLQAVRYLSLNGVIVYESGFQYGNLIWFYTNLNINISC